MFYVCVFMMLSCVTTSVLGKKNSTKIKKDVYWADTLDEHTKHYAFKTYQQFFAHKLMRVVDETEFKKRLASATTRAVTPAQLLSMNIGNERLERYWDKKTPEEVYPEGDRPLGHYDVKIIYDLMSTNKPVSPLLLGTVKFKDGFEQTIFLDGMHRAVAAHLSNRSLFIFIVDLR